MKKIHILQCQSRNTNNSTTFLTSSMSIFDSENKYKYISLLLHINGKLYWELYIKVFILNLDEKCDKNIVIDHQYLSLDD